MILTYSEYIKESIKDDNICVNFLSDNLYLKNIGEAHINFHEHLSLDGTLDDVINFLFDQFNQIINIDIEFLIELFIEIESFSKRKFSVYKSWETPKEYSISFEGKYRHITYEIIDGYPSDIKYSSYRNTYKDFIIWDILFKISIIDFESFYTKLKDKYGVYFSKKSKLLL